MAREGGQPGVLLLFPLPLRAGGRRLETRGARSGARCPDVMVFYYLLTYGWPGPPLDHKLQEGATWPACFRCARGTSMSQGSASVSWVAE